MKTTEMEKREILRVWWPDNCYIVNDEVTTSIEMRVVHHGDRDEFWIAEYEYDPADESWREVTWHNPRYVKSIIWA